MLRNAWSNRTNIAIFKPSFWVQKTSKWIFPLKIQYRFLYDHHTCSIGYKVKVVLFYFNANKIVV